LATARYGRLNIHEGVGIAHGCIRAEADLYAGLQNIPECIVVFGVGSDTGIDHFHVQNGVMGLHADGHIQLRQLPNIFRPDHLKVFDTMAEARRRSAAGSEGILLAGECCINPDQFVICAITNGMYRAGDTATKEKVHA